ncbi:hypothetical protein DM46_2342 [Burkholderia mallei]|nr:hypothetical protein DM46_2342 [Burkholderia mallei]
MRGRRLHVGRAAHTPVVVAVQRGTRQVRDAARLLVAAFACEANPERRVEPCVHLPPAYADEPRQPDDEQRDHRERRADVAEHVLEAARERVAERIAWPSAFVVASPVSAVASVQLAVSTPTKPSQSRIEPGPARPPPPGSAALTSRQKRGMNQTAEKPNQPRTTVCMLRNRRRTGARRATPSSLTGRRRCFRERRAFSCRPRARPGGWRPPSGSPAGPSAARRAYLPSRRANVSVASASVMMTSCCGARICTPAFEMWPSAAR